MEQEELTPEHSRYPVGSEAEIVLVTPEMASDWLHTRTFPHQRNSSNFTVSRYKRDMEEGRWRLTRQGLVFDTLGRLIDGSHRMRALANCSPETLTAAYGEAGVYFWVYPDEAADTFDSYDQNYRRTAGHLIKEPNSVMISAAARLLSAALDRDPYGFPRMGRVTTSEILQIYRDWPELSRYVGRACVLKVAVKVSAAEHLAVLAQAARTEHGTPERIEDWFTALHHGVGLAITDPRLHLRNRFMTGHVALAGSGVQRVQRYALIAKAWNTYATGGTMRVLSWRSSAETVPMIEGFDALEEKNA